MYLPRYNKRFQPQFFYAVPTSQTMSFRPVQEKPIVQELKNLINVCNDLLSRADSLRPDVADQIKAQAAAAAEQLKSFVPKAATAASSQGKSIWDTKQRFLDD